MTAAAALFMDLGTEEIFWVCAVGGTTFFALRMLLMLIGGMGDVDSLDAEPSFDDVDAGAAAKPAGSTAAFRMLSITAFTGFFMMFGWVGLASLKEFGLTTAPSVAFATLAGVVTMWLTGLLFQQAGRLTSGGAAFNLARTVGSVATVYARIPGDGRGRVQLTIGDMTHEVDATSEAGVDLESLSAVRVVRVVDAQTVAVEAQ